MNPDVQRTLAHQLLLDASVFKDARLGANKCSICTAAVLQKAGEVAHLIYYKGSAIGEDGRLIGTESVTWDTPVDIVGQFDIAVRIAHKRHSD
jgi:hypothetical protein